jgi:chromate transporter
MSDDPATRSSSNLAEVARVFLRLGLTAFGGPAAHVAMMQDEVVARRRWMTPDRFLDLLGAANLIPGPSSTELAIFIGYERAGLLGLVVAGVSFILPAASLVTTLAWAYVRFGSLPQVAGVLYGIKPVVIAIVFQALWALAPRAIKRSPRLAILGLAACAASMAGLDPLIVLLAAGVVSAATPPWKARSDRLSSFQPSTLGALAAAGATTVVPASLATLFLTFLKIGSVVFGSGYVLLAFLRGDLVDRLHWLRESELLDAVAIGQVTPGPVFTTATFIGYLVMARRGFLAGVAGAAVATFGIFLPGFFLVLLTRPLLARVRRSETASAFLDGVNVAALALMIVVLAQLARAAVVDLPTLVLAAGGTVALTKLKLSSTWMLLLGAVIGAIGAALR